MFPLFRHRVREQVKEEQGDTTQEKIWSSIDLDVLSANKSEQ
jgi:hypothetical protein